MSPLVQLKSEERGHLSWLPSILSVRTEEYLLTYDDNWAV